MPRHPTQCQLAAQQRTAAPAIALFNRILSHGWTCPHCRAAGRSEKEFRLSLGPQSAVICRACGWPQNPN